MNMTTMYLFRKKLTIVLWCNEVQTQLNSITNKLNQILDAANKVVTLNQCRGRTVLEHVCDACPLFRLLKVIAKTATKGNLPFFGLLEKMSKYFSN